MIFVLFRRFNISFSFSFLLYVVVCFSLCNKYYHFYFILVYFLQGGHLLCLIFTFQDDFSILVVVCY